MQCAPLPLHQPESTDWVWICKAQWPPVPYTFKGIPCPTHPQGNGPGAPLSCFLSAWRLQPCPEECKCGRDRSDSSSLHLSLLLLPESYRNWKSSVVHVRKPDCCLQPGCLRSLSPPLQSQKGGRGWWGWKTGLPTEIQLQASKCQGSQRASSFLLPGWGLGASISSPRARSSSETQLLGADLLASPQQWALLSPAVGGHGRPA